MQTNEKTITIRHVINAAKIFLISFSCPPSSFRELRLRGWLSASPAVKELLAARCRARLIARVRRGLDCCRRIRLVSRGRAVRRRRARHPVVGDGLRRHRILQRSGRALQSLRRAAQIRYDLIETRQVDLRARRLLLFQRHDLALKVCNVTICRIHFGRERADCFIQRRDLLVNLLLRNCHALFKLLSGYELPLPQLCNYVEESRHACISPSELLIQINRHRDDLRKEKSRRLLSERRASREPLREDVRPSGGVRLCVAECSLAAGTKQSESDGRRVSRRRFRFCANTYRRR